METPLQQDWRDPTAPAEFASEGYSDQLIFHILDHGEDTVDNVRELGKWCVLNGQEVNFYVLDWAAWGHDYGYFQYKDLSDAEKERWPSREKYAAAMTRARMEALGAPEDVIAQVEEAIWSTELGVECTTQEGRILRQADLQNVGSKDVVDFLRNTVKLFKEERFLEGKPTNIFKLPEFVAFCHKQFKALSIYNAENVSLGDFDQASNGMSLLSVASAPNIANLLPRRIQSLYENIGSLLFKDQVETLSDPEQD